MTTQTLKLKTNKMGEKLYEYKKEKGWGGFMVFNTTLKQYFNYIVAAKKRIYDNFSFNTTLLKYLKKLLTKQKLERKKHTLSNKRHFGWN